MKHYVVVLDWATEEDAAIDILGVTHSIEEAQEIFNAQLLQERKFAEDNGYDIDEDNAVMFGAGKMGYWRDNHTMLYIQGVN